MTAASLQPIGSARATGTILALLEERTGQRIEPNRSWRIETALKPLMRERGFTTIDQLAHALGSDPAHPLSESIVDALLNQETSFFRDTGVMEMVADGVAKFASARQNHRCRIWSAGCSTGQEPLSLAMLFAERALLGKLVEPEIQASDISARAVARAREGRYSQFEIQRGLPMRRMINWFDQDGDDWVAKQDLRRRITFRRHNLFEEPPLIGRFDVILCRNVLLYFALPLRQRVLASLASALRPGGLLVLGAGETVIGQTDLLEPSSDFRGLYQLKA